MLITRLLRFFMIVLSLTELCVRMESWSQVNLSCLLFSKCMSNFSSLWYNPSITSIWPRRVHHKVSSHSHLIANFKLTRRLLHYLFSVVRYRYASILMKSTHNINLAFNIYKKMAIRITRSAVISSRIAAGWCARSIRKWKPSRTRSTSPISWKILS